ncbi:hypothetical protein AB0L80_02385 [Streptomyces sp. NPDC052069]|uniref:hypothetical protein n=1 Tax=Streptomyces sp. NPDC052069 TaxID=3154650 RepID=UPI0034195647
MTVRSAWLLPGGNSPGQTREDTRLAPLGTMLPDGELTTRAGVIPGGNPFAATGAGAMALQIGIGRGTAQGTTAQGAYPLALDAPQTVTFGDGDALFARVDTVALRVYDQLFDVHGKNLAALEVIQGDPDATPTAPTLEPASLPLWDVTVPAGTSAGVGGIDWNSALTDRRRYTVAVGGVIPRAATAEQGAYDGQYADMGGVLMRWSATAGEWQPYRPPRELEVATSGMVMAAGYTLRSYRASRSAGVAFLSLEVSRNGAQLNVAAGGNINDENVGTVPAGWRPAADVDIAVSDGYGDGTAKVGANGVIVLRTWSGGGALRSDRNIRMTPTYLLP